MGDYPGNTSVTVICVCDLGQVASLHVASVHPAVQVGTWLTLGKVKAAVQRWQGLRGPQLLWDTPDAHPRGSHLAVLSSEL